MADILGAAAGSSMVMLVMMLVICFLNEIGMVKRAAVMEWGRVFLLCGIFAAIQYGTMVLMRFVLYGTENVYTLCDVAQHRLFDRFWTLPEHAAQYAITFSVVMMAVAGALLFQGIKKMTNTEMAKQGLVVFYLLPGCEFLLMPFGFGWIAVIVCAAFFAMAHLMKKQMKEARLPAALYYGAVVILGMMRFFGLLRFVMGV